MLSIPFYPNSRDNKHCVQAALRSVLKFYFPKKNYSFLYLDRVTAHRKGKWTWNSAMLIFLSQLGFNVIDIGGGFRYEKFAQSGEKYLRAIWAKEIFETQKRFSDFKREQKLARTLVKRKTIKLVNRPATLPDIRRLSAKGYVLLCRINPYVLVRKKNYGSHTVIVTELMKQIIRYHDPGLPPLKNQKTSLRLFLRAMGYPAPESASLIAVRYPKQV